MDYLFETMPPIKSAISYLSKIQVDFTENRINNFSQEGLPDIEVVNISPLLGLIWIITCGLLAGALAVILKKIK